MAMWSSCFSLTIWWTFIYLLLSLTFGRGAPRTSAAASNFQVPSSISAYLTLEPDWNIQEGDAVNFTCTISSSISNNVLYLASLTNSSLFNIVQVQYAYQKASISTIYSSRVSVYVLESLNTVLFGFSNMSVRDSGTYMCYMKTVYSTPVDSNTVTIKVFAYTDVSNTILPSITSTTVESLAISSTNSSINLTLIIAVTGGGAIGIILIVLFSVLIVRYRAKQRALKRRLQIFETSRQQSLEETIQVPPTSPPCHHQQPSIIGFSRQSSYDTSISQSAEPFSQRIPGAISSPSTNVVYDPPCILSKALILQNVTNDAQYDNIIVPAKRPVSGRMPPTSPTAASVPADLTSKLNSHLSRSQSTLNHLATSDLSGNGVDIRPMRPSQTLPQISSISSNPISPSASNSAKKWHPTVSQGVPPHTNQRDASSSAKTNNYADTNKQRTSAAKAMQRYSEDNFSPGRPNQDAPPCYNQVLLSNQAVALFGDTLRIPRSSLNQSTSQTFPDEQFVSNEVYCPGFPEQPNTSRTN